MSFAISIVLVLIGAMFCMFCGTAVENYDRSRSEPAARRAVSWGALGLIVLLCAILVR